MARPERKKLQRRFYLSLTDRQRERERSERKEEAETLERARKEKEI